MLRSFVFPIATVASADNDSTDGLQVATVEKLLDFERNCVVSGIMRLLIRTVVICSDC